jgi:putative ABC transport system permease protein
MFTECPICGSIYRFLPEWSEQCQFIVQCRRCSEVFDCAVTRRNDPYVSDYDRSGVATREPRPVPVGDRIVLRFRTSHPELLRGQRIRAPERTAGELEVYYADRGEAEATAPNARKRWPWPRLPVATFRLAARNLARHRRRSLLGLAAVGFGVIALIEAAGFIEWVYWSMREGTIQAHLGHIQVMKPGYLDSGAAQPFDYLLPDDTVGFDSIAAIEHVQAVTPRLAFSGLISHGETTVSFLGEGVDPDKEVLVSRQLSIEEGKNLSRRDPQGMIIGAGLAENLGVGVGDDVVLLATTAAGGINAVEAKVRGLFRSDLKAFDDAALRMPIDLTRELVQASGAHRWVVLIDETERTNEVVERLRELYPPGESGLDVVPWHAMADFYNKTVTLFSRQVKVVQLIIAVIIVLSISNTLIMGVMERTGEIGTLMAIGLKRRVILRLFVTEGVLLGIVGGVVGAIIGAALAQAISKIGIPMPPPPQMSVGYDGEILLTPALVLTSLTVAVLATIVASVYPSWKASRLEIVDALRKNQ